MTTSTVTTAQRGTRGACQGRTGKKVALVVPGLLETGGVASMARFLAQMLRDSGRYEPVLVSVATSSRDLASVRLLHPPSWWRGIDVLEGEWEGFRYRHVGSVLAELEPCRYRPRQRLGRILNRCDLVQVVAGAPAWSLVARGVRPPVLLQVATLNALERAHQICRRWPPSALWRGTMARYAAYLDSRALLQMRRVFVYNQIMYDFVTERIGPDRVEFAPPGVDARRFRPGEQQQGEPYLLAVGRLRDERKNVRLLLHAYRRLQGLVQDPPKLVLAGSSMPEASVLRLVEELGIRSRVELVRNPTSERLAAYYRGATVFVLSSNEEGLGIVILEAMASGIPVVSTSCGGPETLVVEGETGFLTPVGDAVAMADCLAVLLRDEALRRRMGRRARQRVESHFTLQVVGQKYLEAYDRLLGGDELPSK